MRTLPELHRHISRAIERGKGVRLEADDLDLMVESGAFALLASAAAEAQKVIAARRIAERAAILPPSPSHRPAIAVEADHADPIERMSRRRAVATAKPFRGGKRQKG